MTNGAYNKKRRYGSNGYSVEYPEFGQLLIMLLEFLANFFKSMFSGNTPSNPGAGNSDDNGNGNSNDAAPSSTSTPNPGFSQTYTPSMTTRRAATPLATPEADTATYTTANKPSKR